jgi:RNA polymerase sigma-70 factor (ECF subfamily)
MLPREREGEIVHRSATIALDEPRTNDDPPGMTGVAVTAASALAEETDQQLMARLCQRDIHALEVLYDRHHQIALGLACKIVRDHGLAEDVVQDAFMTLWRQPDRFDPTRGTARGWLLAIVHHRSIDKLRRSKLANRTVELSPNLVDEHSADPFDQAVENIQSEQLRAALNKLPSDQRRAIELSFLHGRTHTEIAELMGCPLGTVKGRIRIGLTKLRTLVPASAMLTEAGQI